MPGVVVRATGSGIHSHRELHAHGMPCLTARVYRPKATPACGRRGSPRLPRFRIQLGYGSRRAHFDYGRHSQPNRACVPAAAPAVTKTLIESGLPAGMIAVAVLVHVVAVSLIVQVTAVSCPLTLIVNVRLFALPGAAVSMTDKFWAVQAVLEESVWWFASLVVALSIPTTAPKLSLPVPLVRLVSLPVKILDGPFGPAGPVAPVVPVAPVAPWGPGDR